MSGTYCKTASRNRKIYSEKYFFTKGSGEIQTRSGNEKYRSGTTSDHCWIFERCILQGVKAGVG